MANRKVKGNLDVENDLILSSKTTSRALEIDGSGNVEPSTVTSTELGHLSGVTSDIQTQLDSKAADADVIKKDGSVAYTGDQSMGSNKITDLAAPTGDNDAARKIDVDTATAGLKVKDPVDVVSTSNLTLSGEQTIDGVLTSTSRILVAGQTNADDNGIYVTAAGAWSRATDFDGNPDGEAAQGNIVLVLNGTDNTDTHYVLNTTDAADPTDIQIGSETNGWTIYSRAEAIAAGDGLDKSGLTLSVDASDIAGTGLEDDGSNNLRVSSTAAGTGLTGGSGSALAIDFGTTGSKAVSATTLASSNNGEGASLIGVEDAAANFTATDVEGVLTEIQTDVDTKQTDVITTEGDLVIGNGSGEESRLAIGGNGTVLQSDGSTASWQAISTADEQVKVSANDTTEKYLEDAITSNDSSITISTLNDGADEDLNIVVDPSNVDHDSLQNFVANEHIDHSSVDVETAADSGLTGGGDLTATRSLSVDISGTTAETSADDADLVLIHDDSAGAKRSMTRANFLSGIAQASNGDISDTQFNGAESASGASVTGLVFANATTRSFRAQVVVVIDATADLFEVFTLHGVQKGASWDMSVESTGDDTSVSFAISAAGQVTYTSSTYAGFVSLKMKFRAETLDLEV